MIGFNHLQEEHYGILWAIEYNFIDKILIESLCAPEHVLLSF